MLEEDGDTMTAVDGARNISVCFRQKRCNDELHVVVVDEDGGISGVPGTILETYSNVSKAFRR